MKGHLSVLAYKLYRTVLFKYANVLFVSGVVVGCLISVSCYVVVVFMPKLKYTPGGLSLEDAFLGAYDEVVRDVLEKNPYSDGLIERWKGSRLFQEESPFPSEFEVTIGGGWSSLISIHAEISVKVNPQNYVNHTDDKIISHSVKVYDSFMGLGLGPFQEYFNCPDCCVENWLLEEKWRTATKRGITDEVWRIRYDVPRVVDFLLDDKVLLDVY